MRPHSLRRVLVSFAIVGVLASLGIQRVVGERGSPATPILPAAHASSWTSDASVAVVPSADDEVGNRLDQERESLRAVLMQPLPKSASPADPLGPELPVAQ